MDTYLFLDLDGVLNTNTARASMHCQFHSIISRNQPLERRHIDFVQECVDEVARFYNDHCTKLVISSMWRFNAKPEHFSELLALYGWIVNAADIDTICQNTYEGEGEGGRCKLIAEYVERNGVQRFVIADDTSKHFITLRNYLVLTDANHGFTAEDYQHAVLILEQQDALGTL